MATINVRGEEAWKRIRERLGKKALVRAGVMEGATYPDGKSVAGVAAVQEFGGPDIPPRPFLRRTYETHNKEWIERLARLLQGNRPPDAALELIGRLMMADIQATIDDSPSWAEPNSELTLARKESDKPLYHTGVLRGAIDYEVAE